MGVMVQCADIIAKAKELKVDIIGLSGLITPSLDEMVFVAKEMAKSGLSIPLLIGGATTSKMHAAVKIAPLYSTVSHPVVHVLDASRSVVVVGTLLNEEQKEEYVTDILEDYQEMREDYYASLDDITMLPFEKAVSKAKKIDFETAPPAPTPSQLGTFVVEDVSLADVVPYIDWNPFFQTWELRGRYPNRGYPKIFNDENVGEEAKKLFADGEAMVKKIIDENLMTLKGIFGLYPANRVGEDVEVYDPMDSARDDPTARFCMLRQQAEKEGIDPYYSQADFIAPKGIEDHIGMFAVGCFGVEELGAKYEAELDDYNKILAQAIGDRFVEAFAEKLHRDMRMKFWGYAKEEEMDTSDLLKIKYDGIRPAPGYPTQPDHTEKSTMWELMKVTEKVGIELTESLAMVPAASVSAICFAHPDSQYFAVGKINRDQIESYAERKKKSVEDVEKWLSPILNYDRDM